MELAVKGLFSAPMQWVWPAEDVNSGFDSYSVSAKSLEFIVALNFRCAQESFLKIYCFFCFLFVCLYHTVCTVLTNLVYPK